MENNKQMQLLRRIKWYEAKGIIEGLLASYSAEEMTVSEYEEADRMVKEFFVAFEQITDIMENKEQKKLTAVYVIRWMAEGHYQTSVHFKYIIKEGNETILDTLEREGIKDTVQYLFEGHCELYGAE